MTPIEENKIIESVLAGNRDSYASLVDAYKRTIFNLAFRMTGSYHDADDLAQETFIKAYINLRRFDPEKRFFTWLYTISLNLIRNHLKQIGWNISREITERTVSAEEIIDGDRMERKLIQAQEINRMETSLQDISIELREAIVLRFYQDLSFEEIATISDTSLSAVKMRVYRGLERLKSLMGKV